MVKICNSSGWAKTKLFNIFFQSDKRQTGCPDRLVIGVRGFRPKCNWKGVIFSVLCGVCLIVLIATWTLSSEGNPSSKLTLVNDLIVRIVLLTNPVPVCKFGVHRIRFIF